MAKKVQAGSDGQPGKRRKGKGKGKGKGGAGGGGSHAPMTPAEEEAERRRRMERADRFTDGKPMWGTGRSSDPFGQ